MFSFFGHKARGILAPQPRIEPAPPALESEVLTTGPPGKSQRLGFFIRPPTHPTVSGMIGSVLCMQWI